MASCSCFLTSGVCSSRTSLSACSYSNALAMVKASPQFFLLLLLLPWLQPSWTCKKHHPWNWRSKPNNHRFQPNNAGKLILTGTVHLQFQGSPQSSGMAMGDFPRARYIWRFPKMGVPQNGWFIEGSLEVKLPTVWTDGNAEAGRVREEKPRSEKIREEKEKEERRCRCAR